jgi:pilus assembly protein Flp/PilA
MINFVLRSLKDAMPNDNSGATAIEYGLIAALVAIAAVGAMTVVGTDLSATFNAVASSL